jgi:hypothetical protein
MGNKSKLFFGVFQMFVILLIEVPVLALSLKTLVVLYHFSPSKDHYGEGGDNAANVLLLRDSTPF